MSIDIGFLYITNILGLLNKNVSSLLVHYTEGLKFLRHVDNLLYSFIIIVY